MPVFDLLVESIRVDSAKRIDSNLLAFIDIVVVVVVAVGHRCRSHRRRQVL